jgi:perosamine synthetase
MTIPIANPIISEQAKEAVVDVLDSGMLAAGEVVRQFEEEFAEFVGVDHAIATANGTAALHAMFEAAGIGEGDAVVTTPFSFISSANAIKHAGAEPVFADIDPETYNLDPESVREVLQQRSDVTAIMPVHLYGLPADMDEFRDLAAEYDVQLFEDAAQAHGATYRGESVGSLGKAGAFSFYPTKNMTTAEGGMITTNDDELAARARQVVNHGRTGKYEHEFVGYNYRLTNVGAAIGREQLARLPDWVQRRRENASALTDRLRQVSSVRPPTIPDDRTHAFHQYTIEVDNRERAKEVLDEHSVGYGVYYPRTIPDQPAYEGVEACIPHARRATERVLSVPVHPRVDSDDVTTISKAVQESLEVVVDE